MPTPCQLRRPVTGADGLLPVRSPNDSSSIYDSGGTSPVPWRRRRGILGRQSRDDVISLLCHHRVLAGIGAVLLVLLVVVVVRWPSSNKQASRVKGGPLLVHTALQHGSMDLNYPYTFLSHVQALTSEAMEGRAPGTDGETRAVDYIMETMEAAGLDSVQKQNVPMTGLTLKEGYVDITGDAAASRSSLQLGVDICITGDPSDTALNQCPVSGGDCGSYSFNFKHDIIFGGFCIQSSEHNWDDFARAESLVGKTVLCLVNEPDDDFGGPDLLTLHGRWTTKLSLLRKMGAAGGLLIHTNQSAGYGWGVVSAGHVGGEKLQLRANDNRRMELKGWISGPAADRLVQQSRQCVPETGRMCSLAALVREASTRDFSPMSLGLRIAASGVMHLRTLSGINVIGTLRAPASTRNSDQYVLVSSHHDHLGMVGDSIFAGAGDNASGVAALLSMLTALTAAVRSLGSAVQLQRDVRFVSFTGEEAGLLGSTHFAESIQFGGAGLIENAVLSVNFDVMNVLARTTDVVALGSDLSTVGATLEPMVLAENLTLSPADDRSRRTGSLLRSDAFVFAARKIPTVYLWYGRNSVDPVRREIGAMREKYVRERYHQPGDVFDDSWDSYPAIQQLRVATRLVSSVASSSQIFQVYQLP